MEKAISSIKADMARYGTRTLLEKEFHEAFEELKARGDLSRVSYSRFEEFALQEMDIHREVIQRPLGYGRASNTVRFSFGKPTEYELAASLRKDAYLSHATAVFLHGLNDEIPRTIFVNWEQTPKPRPHGGLTQDRLNYAFRRPQRASNLIYKHDDVQMVVVNGKHTGKFGLSRVEVSPGAFVPVTDVERTLVDIVVRPGYAGGAGPILSAYRRAAAIASPKRILAVLKHLDYIYPYHQAIGFLLERAGASQAETQQFRERGLQFDFYLMHGMKSPDYDKSWRLYFPKGL